MTKDNENISELLPCPFCGGEALVEREILRHQLIGTRWRCHCSICGADGSPKKIKQEAIKAWNTRPIEEKLQAEKAELELKYNSILSVQNQNDSVTAELLECLSKIGHVSKKAIDNFDDYTMCADGVYECVLSNYESAKQILNKYSEDNNDK